MLSPTHSRCKHYIAPTMMYEQMIKPVVPIKNNYQKSIQTNQNLKFKTQILRDCQENCGLVQNHYKLKLVIIRSKLSDGKIEERKWGTSKARENS